MTGGRDGWPGTETVLTTSEYGATLQKGQLCSLSLPLSHLESYTLYPSLSFSAVHIYIYTTMPGQEKMQVP